MARSQAVKAFGIVDVPARIATAEIVSPPQQILNGGLVLEFPAPPSINRAGAEWRLGNSASRVRRWRRAADAHLLVTGQHRKLDQRIDGYFTIDIVWDRHLADELNGDIDNRIKYLLDYLQYLRVFENDSLCRFMTVGYGNVPDGCRVRLRPWNWS